MESLNAEQKELLASFQDITGTDDVERAIVVLSAANFDVAVAVAHIFDGTTPAEEEEIEMEENIPLMARTRAAGNVVGPVGVGLGHYLRQLFTQTPIGRLLFFPAGLILGLIAWIGRSIRIRAIRPRNPFARDPNARLTDPTSAAERWVSSPFFINY